MHAQGAVYLSAAIVDLFPKALLVSKGSTDKLFFVDVAFPFAFQKENLALLEERARILVKQSGSFSSLEMMPKNAAELFRKEGQWILADQLKALKQSTVFVHRHEGKVLGFGEPLCADVEIGAEIRIFSFQHVYRHDEKVVRLLGVMGENRQELKKKAKELSLLRSHEELSMGGALVSVVEGEWVLKPRGEELRQSLISLWRGKVKALGVEPIGFCDPSVLSEKEWIQRFIAYLGSGNESRVGAIGPAQYGVDRGVQEGFLASDLGTLDLCAMTSSDENFLDQLISSLQFILEIPKIFSFEFEVVVSLSLEAPKVERSRALAACEKALHNEGLVWRVERERYLPYLARIELRVKDSLGRSWVSSFIGLARDEPKVIFVSLFYSLERMLALLLEVKQRDDFTELL